MASFVKAVPNILSGLRVLAVIPLIYSIYIDNLYLTIGISVIMVLSDYFDGFLARKWNIISTSGKIIDPIADKLCISAIGVALVVMRDLPTALFITLIIRDVLILAAGTLVIGKAKRVPVSNITGKITVGIFATCFIVYLFNIEPLKLASVIASYIMVPVSLISYTRKLIRESKYEKMVGETLEK